jgi:hypothetical protein
MAAGRLGLVLLLAAWVGCASTRPTVVDYAAADREFRAADYPATLAEWTRYAKLVQDLGTVLEGWATLKGPSFRQAYVAKYAAVYSLPDAEREGLLKAQLQAAKTTYEIHLIAQSTSHRWNDLERRTSPWRVSLVDGTGAELGPTSIKVEKFPELYEQNFFPDRTPFSRSYTLKFAKPDEDDGFVGPSSGRLILRLSSPQGHVEFVWETR